MPNRTKLFVAFLPIAAIALMAAETVDSIRSIDGLRVTAQAATLDAAPRGRAPIRGARPAPQQPADAAPASTNGAALYAGHPRRQHSRPLPQTGNGVVLTAEEPRLSGSRRARG